MCCVLLCIITYILNVSDKIPDDKYFNNGSKDRHSWEADNADDTYGNDNNGTFSHDRGHVKFDAPRVPVIFVLGERNDL